MLVPTFEFNMAKLSFKAGVDKDAAQETIQILVRCVGQVY
jgi:hypothetical protein